MKSSLTLDGALYIKPDLKIEELLKKRDKSTKRKSMTNLNEAENNMDQKFVK